ncbi:MAG: hypothetical protein QG674_237 [Patescibacteria group bacterium]|jgi:hypothetical protein|nr:hypothetical protein [Patescibacteria group bacterium]
MNLLETTNIKINQKDIEKGQKILAAVYLVTDHLPETESLRISLRSAITSFVCDNGTSGVQLLKQIEILLGGAVFAGLISEKNSSIIIYEMKHFYQTNSVENKTSVLENLLSHTDHHTKHTERHLKDTKKTFQNTFVPSFKSISNTVSNSKNLLNKSARQEAILSFINERKSAVIKDIISLFPEVSEKTIQRELNTLIDAGRITKRGTKRWSIYMAVNSLL